MFKVFTKLLKRNQENKALKTAAVMAFVVTVVVNGLANALPINDVTSGAVSDSYPNLFAPIGFTFSIWSVIYALLAAFCVYQFSSFRKRSKIKEQTLNQLLPYFIASSVLNSIWIFTWHYRMIGWSVVLITGILLCLLKINLILLGQKKSTNDYRFIQLPFSIYYGWITVATIANITTYLVFVGWDGLGLSDAFWTSVVLIAGLAIGLMKFEKFKDAAYLLVIGWAYFGILAKHVSPDAFNEQYPGIIAILALSLGAIGYRIFLHKFKQS